MEIALFVLASFLVSALVLAFASYANRRSMEAMRRLASELGYEFRQASSPIPGAPGRGAEAPAIAGFSPEAAELSASGSGAAASPYAGGAPGTADSPYAGGAAPDFLKRLAGLFAAWRILGREGGESVSIYTVNRGSGRSRNIYTATEMSLSPKENASFALSKEGVFSKMGKALFGMQDIQIGDDEFDEKFMVKGSDAEAVRRLFSSEGLRRAVIAAAQAYPGISITNRRIAHERQGTISEPEYFRPLIAAMAEVARAMRD